MHTTASTLTTPSPTWASRVLAWPMVVYKVGSSQYVALHCSQIQYKRISNLIQSSSLHSHFHPIAHIAMAPPPNFPLLNTTRQASRLLALVNLCGSTCSAHFGPSAGSESSWLVVSRTGFNVNTVLGQRLAQAAASEPARPLDV